MAWLSLAIITLVFFTPLIGLGQTIIERDIAVQIPLLPVAVRIPFTGSLRLFLYSFVAWFVLWRGVLLIEKSMDFDMLDRIGLRKDLVYARRPYLSSQIASRLATWMMILGIVRLVLLILIQLVINKAIPWLAAQLAPDLASRTVPFLSVLLDGLVKLDFGVMLLVFSLIVIIANRGYKWEKRYRFSLDRKRNQQTRKKNQEDLKIPLM